MKFFHLMRCRACGVVFAEGRSLAPPGRPGEGMSKAQAHAEFQALADTDGTHDDCPALPRAVADRLGIGTADAVRRARFDQSAPWYGRPAAERSGR